MTRSSTQHETIDVAFVGAGGMAREHIRAFADVPGVRCVGIHSRTRDKAQALADELGLAHVCDSVAELFEETQAQLVVMAVPELAANAVARQCFEHDWAMLAEKPLGYNLTDARDIQQAADAKNRHVFVGLNRRFLSSTQAALKDLSEREGKRFIQVHDAQSQDIARQVGHPQEIIDTWMFANSIHLVDYLCAFGRGKIEDVTRGITWNGGDTCAVVATVRFDSGDVGVYQAVWGGPGPWMTTVTTPSRRWEMRPLEQASYQNDGERVLHPVEVDAWDQDFKPGFRLQAEHVIRALRGQASDAVTLEQAMVTMELIDTLYAG